MKIQNISKHFRIFKNISGNFKNFQNFQKLFKKFRKFHIFKTFWELSKPKFRKIQNPTPTRFPRMIWNPKHLHLRIQRGTFRNLKQASVRRMIRNGAGIIPNLKKQNDLESTNYLGDLTTASVQFSIFLTISQHF